MGKETHLKPVVYERLSGKMITLKEAISLRVLCKKISREICWQKVRNIEGQRR